jgi:hypothetical protein
MALVLVLSPHLGELSDDILPDLLGDIGRGDAIAMKKTQDLVTARPPAGAELHPPRRQVVQHGHPLGQLGRVVDLGKGVENARAEVNALGRASEVAEHHIVGGQVGILIEEMMLGRPDVLETSLIGGLRVLEVVA